MLKCESNTNTVQAMVEKSARKYFRQRKGVNAFFEHGQWWIELSNGAQYSVNDAEGGDSVNGFCFEMVTEPYND